MHPALIKFRKEIVITSETTNTLLKSYFDSLYGTMANLRIVEWNMKDESTRQRYLKDLKERSQNAFHEIAKELVLIEDVTRIKQLEYIDFDLFIDSFSTYSPETLNECKIRIHFMTDFHLLLDGLESKLLLTSKENEEAFKAGEHFSDCFFVELPKDVIIGSYKPIMSK